MNDPGALFLRASLLVVLLPCATASAQFDGDDVRYRTIALEELPAELAGAPGALLLDVRSPGEFHDTSSWAGLNIGRFRGALNINFREVPQRLSEIGTDRQRPIYVYCSHSQRSRRVSNALADSGYAHVVNVNAGLSRYWQQQEKLEAVDDLLERSTTYGILSGAGLCELMASREVQLVDLRPDSLLDPARKPERVHAMGEFRDAVHMPMDKLGHRMAQFAKDEAIVLIDEGGGEAGSAAIMLQRAGFSDVHVLFDGLSGLMSADAASFPCRNECWRATAPYTIIPRNEIDTVAIAAGAILVIDVRSEKEYNEQGSNGPRRMNRFRGAVHMPAADINARIGELKVRREQPILLVGDMTGGPTLDAARALCDKGHAKVMVLADGIWGMRWAAHNLTGQHPWKNWLEDRGASEAKATDGQ